MLRNLKAHEVVISLLRESNFIMHELKNIDPDLSRLPIKMLEMCYKFL
jgi:hypothetical protein